MDVTSLVSWWSIDASVGYPRKPLRCWRVSGVRPIPTLTLNWKTWKWWQHLGSFCFWLVVVVIYGRVFIQDLPGFEPWNCLDDFTLLILVVCFVLPPKTEDLRRADGVPCVSWMSLLVLQGFGVSRWVFRMVHRPKGRFWCLSLAPKWQNAVLHIHFGVSGQMWNTIDELPKNQMLENAHQYNVMYDYELWFTVYQVLYIEYYTCMVWVEDTLCLSLFLA